LIPDHKVTTASAVEPQANQGLFSSVAGSVVSGLLSAFGGATHTSNTQVTNLANLGNVVGTGLSTISKLSSPKTTRQVEISQGSVYILTLQAPVTLQPNVVPTTLPTPTAAIPASVATSTVPPAQSQAIATAFITPTQREAAPASATVIYVNSATGADSAGESGKTYAAPYKTITYALSQAQPGTVIQLATGSYTDKTGEVFPLVLKQGVTLCGDESNKGQSTVITGGGFYISPTFARQDITVRAQNNSTITGVSVSNPNTRGTALWIESTNPTVKNSTFVNSNREGIFVTGTAAPKIEANIFTKNGGNGISVTRSAQGEICNNLFQDTGFGLAIGDTSFPMVVGNKIIQNTDGIVISDDARPLLRHNVINNNLHEGVVVSVNAKPNLGTAESAGNNIIRSNGHYDIYNATTSNTLVAVGNDIDAEHISGQVAFEATSQVGVDSSYK
jgi:parallel beta-helix repeat protein